ncbi:substrate-binding domain-containing protein [Streptomyces sp. NBC_00335]|uniref:substrate-binding domain-containing protein n=1 Tax=unclassified Streptomyces TaxID=2593676 RepID=UPI00224DFD53|nr:MULTISPECIES: substrate-binding domain-containing protein [unclassified Streptomyces]MCX5402679.1 substrate-binding domain-containing protein [Streptomyces sp. NBC_00086]
MHAEERQQAILRRVREAGSMRVTDFAAELGVSVVTVRKDVEVLAERGLLARVHGGAMLPEDWAETAPVTAAPPAARATSASAAPGAGAGPGAGSASGRPLVLGLIVPSSAYYYPEVIKGAREAADALGVRLTLAVSTYDVETEKAQAARMVADGVDGLLLAPSAGDGKPGGQWYEELGVPVVLIERRPEQQASAAEHVGTDHGYGARLAVCHLLDTGRRRIALVMRGGTPTAPWIKKGYYAAMEEAGPEVAEHALFLDLAEFGAGDAVYEEVMAAFVEGVREGRVDAALVHPDHEAMVLMQRLRGASLAVPGDVALVSYDDEVASLADLPLSAVAPSKHEVGVTGVELLVRRLREPGRPRRRIAILPELRVRASSEA